MSREHSINAQDYLIRREERRRLRRALTSVLRELHRVDVDWYAATLFPGSSDHLEDATPA